MGDGAERAPTAGDVETLVEEGGACGPEPLSELSEGDRAGRYVVLGRLGAGAMGIVYAAYDPKLDRKIALKILQHTGGEAGRQRLLREAQALARLRHPNVVAVHDVGEIAGRVFVAMEFVDGWTLRAWLAEAPRTWREVVDVFRAAGAGLAAAHAAGLVHRDFKPDNVMVGRDGGVRVMDFGLARPAGKQPAARPPELPVAAVEASESALGTDLTRDGAVVGTPAYMAPEQYLGIPTDARSDQFSFCVALYEALYGRRPFAGDTPAAIFFNIGHGNLQPPARRRGPRWLRRVVVRGLAARPEDRWPTMAALLSALDHRARRRRRRVAAAAGIGVAVAAAVGYAGVGGARSCSGAAAPVADVWSEVRDRELAAAFERAGAPGDTYERTRRLLAAYAQRLGAAYRDACEDTRVRGIQSGRMLDLRVRCLDRRTEALRARLDLLLEADPRVLAKGVDVAAALPPVDVCAEPSFVEATVEPPADEATARAVDALHRRLARAEAARDAGRLDEALSEAEATLDDARATGYAPLPLDTKLVLASIHVRRGAYDEARRLREAVYLEARRAGFDVLAGRAASGLASVEGLRLGHVERGRWWARIAEADVGRTGDVDGWMDLTHTRALLARAAGDSEAALRLLERVEAEARKRFPPLHPYLGTLARTRAQILDDRGEYEQARAAAEEAVAVFRESYGAEHPQVAMALSDLAHVELALGHDRKALDLWQQALEILESRLEPDHPEIASIANNVGVAARRLGRYARAERAYRRALEIQRRRLGSEHPLVARSLVNLARVRLLRGRLDEARDAVVEARAILDGDANTDARATALALSARIHARLGDPRTALAHAEEAVRLRRKGPASARGKLAPALEALGSARLAAGRFAAARPPLLEALEIRKARNDGGRKRIRILLVLARVSLAQGRVDEAGRLVGEAEGLEGDADERVRAEVDLALAEVAARRGDRALARRAAERALAVLADPERGDADLAARARTLAGEGARERPRDPNGSGAAPGPAGR